MEPEQGNSSLTTMLSQETIPEPLVTTIAVIMTLVTTIGTLGNILVIAAIALHQELRNVHNVFVANLAVADFLVTATVIPFSVAGAVDKGVFLLQHDTLCKIIGHVAVISPGTSISSIAFISIERYMFLCHQKMYVKIYKSVTIPLMVIFTWLAAAAIDSMNFDFIGLSKHEFREESLTCVMSYGDADIKYVWAKIAYILIYYIVTFLCYLRIYLFVRRQSFTGSSSIKAADKRLLKILAAIFVVLTVMWAPFTFTYMLDLYVPVPNWLHFISFHIVVANSSVNFMIYAFSKDFRDGYKVVCKAVIGWKYIKKVVENNTSNGKRAGNWEDTYL